MEGSSSVHVEDLPLVLLGNANVGKTSLIQSFMGEPFVFTTYATIGTDFFGYLFPKQFELFSQKKNISDFHMS